jgi:ketosteroid isomerase-like protein
MDNSTLRLGLLASAVALASLSISSTAARSEVAPRAVEQLIKDYAQANAALMRGDSGTWATLAPLTEDFVLMSPFGGEPSRFKDYPPDRIERMGKFFRNGRFNQEVVQAYASGDMAVLVTVERANVEVGDLPAQDWALRVTSVFKRDAAGWKLAHRHASPLVHAISLPEAASLAEGRRR